MKTLRIGSGAGYSGDRIEPAVELAEHGDLDYLVFECLAERTIALAQQARISDPQGGYDPLLSERMRRVLPFVGVQIGRRRLRVITNMGAANPVSAAAEVRRIAVELGLDLKVLAVVGDDVLTMLQPEFLLDNGQTVGSLGERLISANAYLGVDGILQALHADADVVITGRVADPRCSWRRRWLSSAGRRTIGRGWGAAPWWVICSNVPGKSAGGILPTRVSRMWMTWRAWVSRWPRLMLTVRP